MSQKNHGYYEMFYQNLQEKSKTFDSNTKKTCDVHFIITLYIVTAASRGDIFQQELHLLRLVDSKHRLS